MRLLRYGPAGTERPGLLDAEGRIRDLSAHLTDLTPATLGEIDRLNSLDPSALPIVTEDVRIGVPVAGIGHRGSEAAIH